MEHQCDHGACPWAASWLCHAAWSMLEQHPVLQHSCCCQRITWGMFCKRQAAPCAAAPGRGGYGSCRNSDAGEGLLYLLWQGGTQRLCALRRFCPPAVRVLPSLETHPQIWEYACSRCCAGAPGGLLTRAPAAGVCLQPLPAAGVCPGLLAGALRAAVLCLCQWYLRAGALAAVPYCGRPTCSCRVCLQLPDLLLGYACSCRTCCQGTLAAA